MFNQAILTVALFSASASFASEATLNSFFSATRGEWTGAGHVAKDLTGGPVSYDIRVHQSTTCAAPGSWKFTTDFTNVPNGPGSTTTYIVARGGLRVSSAQYMAWAHVIKSTAVELAIRTDHRDPVNGASVSVRRDMKLASDTVMHVISDIYQDSQLVEHFDYQVERDHN